ncbi:trypsin-like peptidase domain-containing protein [Micrococcales bacterium 31B]|nr:trypsin-like peptidase domain-containing protein [Micrococcales bacterium 31B]
MSDVNTPHGADDSARPGLPSTSGGAPNERTPVQSVSATSAPTSAATSGEDTDVYTPVTADALTQTREYVPGHWSQAQPSSQAPIANQAPNANLNPQYGGQPATPGQPGVHNSQQASQQGHYGAHAQQNPQQVSPQGHFGAQHGSYYGTQQAPAHADAQGNYSGQALVMQPLQGGGDNRFSSNATTPGYPLLPGTSLAGYPAPPARKKRKTPTWGGMVGVAAIVGVLAGGGGAYAVNSLDGNGTSSVAVFDSSAPAVAPVANSTSQNPQWQAVASTVGKSVVAIYMSGSDPTSGRTGSGSGTGVVIDPKGYVVTNSHVADAFGSSTKLQVVLEDGRAYDATMVGNDPSTDLAVIQITNPPSDLSAASLGTSDSVKVGDSVMAIGTPLDLRNTFTTGIVSALHRPNEALDGSFTSAVQTDAAINPGNSGGPLVNAQGQVIGINSAIAALSSSASEAGSIGLGFAIPVDTVKMIAQQLIENGSAQHSFLGVSVNSTTADLSDGSSILGAGVNEVQSNTPASDAGIARGDVITQVDGVPVSESIGLNAEIRSHAVGSTVQITLIRDGAERTVEVTLAAASTSQ